MAAGSAGERLPRALARGARLRCPRCGRAPLFRGWFTMNTVCPVCDLRFERAQGYWVGAIYVNYGVTTTIAVGGYFLLWRLADLSTGAQLALWVPFVVLFPLWFFRYSRSLWLALEWGVNPEP
ncbi:MAG TPA: DUF983 domain-containing protein [Candidatus Tectomicrobia bacterium]|nr:DUF983 domain-containing protein [Candidatus Tectomicrobia bacterium]